MVLLRTKHFYCVFFAHPTILDQSKLFPVINGGRTRDQLNFFRSTVIEFGDDGQVENGSHRLLLAVLIVAPGCQLSHSYKSYSISSCSTDAENQGCIFRQLNKARLFAAKPCDVRAYFVLG